MLTVSMIIPCYNKIGYLEACVSSVMAQTRLPEEIILVDDCSTDGTRELIVQLASENPRIRPLLLEKNGGVSAARNAGIYQASSDCVTFLDADDILEGSEKLEREMALLEESPEDALVYSLTVLLDSEGHKTQQQVLDKKKLVQGSRANVLLLSGICLNQYVPRDYCIRKETIVRAGMFDESMSYYEDYELLVRLSWLCRFLCSEVPGTGYRQVSGGLSDKSVQKHNDAMAAIRNRYMPRLNAGERICYHGYRVQSLLGRALRKLKRKLQ